MTYATYSYPEKFCTTSSSGRMGQNFSGERYTLPLHRLAHGRAGDKGNTVNISVIAYQPAYYPFLLDQVTVERVTECFRHRQPTAVHRYELPKLHALNFVLEDVLEGGVNQSRNLDSHGKTLAFLLLALPIVLPRYHE